jgi:hypothetical protein
MEMTSARYLQTRSDTSTPDAAATSRELVAAHCIACVPGVDAATAHARSMRFYRSSGHAGAFALA